MTAQECSYLHFSIKDGLAGDNIYNITQDRDGFIWITTETGVSRFDGNSFKNFTIDDGLPSNDVCGIFIDKNNRIWMSPFKKEICFYYNGHIHNRYNDTLLKKVLITSEEKHFAEDSVGNILIETDSNISIINKQGNVRQVTKPYYGSGFFVPIHNVGYISSTIIAGTQRKYRLWNYIKYTYPKLYKLGNGMAAAVFQQESVVLFDSNGRKKNFPFAQKVATISQFDDSAIILNTQTGVLKYNIITKKIDRLISGIAVNTSYRDREGGLWVGTKNAGLLYIPSVTNVSVRRLANNTTLQVYHFYRKGKTITLGTNNWEYWRLSSEGIPYEKLKLDDISCRMLIMSPGNLLHNIESSIVHVLVSKGLMSEVSKSCKSVANNADTIHTALVSGRLQRFLISGKMISDTEWKGRINCSICFNDNFYIGTLEGLYKIPIDSSLHTPDNTEQLLSGNIHTMAYSYNNRTFWIATADDGVYCLKEDKVVKHFSTTNGTLSDNRCKCIYTDGNDAYVGTINGLNIIRPRNNYKVSCYYTVDGLVSNNINCVYAFKDKVWVGTPEGLSCISNLDKRITNFCKLNITEVVAGGKDVSPNTTHIELHPKENDIEFAWSGISFASMGLMEYTYRLKGSNDTWQTTSQQSLSYSSLSSGEYLFEIYATNRDGVTSEVKTIHFTIEKNWWEYWWLKIIAIFFLLLISGSLVWWQMYKRQRRDQEKITLKEKIMELEQLALRAQMNPHFIFNSLNSFYQYVINQDLGGASKFMADFSKLIRLLFDTTTLTNISLEKELEFLRTYLELEKTKSNNTFKYIVKVQPNLATSDIVIPSFIIQPFIENSIRHGIQSRHDRLGEVNISIFIEGDFLLVKVEDNGVGRQFTNDLKKRQINIHKSSGISLTEERISLYNKTHSTNAYFEITDIYEQDFATGTLVTIYFPIKNSL